MRTWSFTKSTAKEERFSNVVRQIQLSGRSSSRTRMYENPRQKASSSLKFRLESVEFEVYVAEATPALMDFVPDTTMVPSILRTCFSPAESVPTSQVSVSSSSVAAPTLAKFSSFGSGRVTTTWLMATEAVFSTSISRAIGPPSSPDATERECSCERAGLVSRRSRRTSILLPLTLYFML